MTRTWKMPLAVEGTVIDVETSSLHRPGEVITCGFFSGNSIKIFQKIDTTEEGSRIFESIIKKAFFFYPRPYSAYNCGFEEYWLQERFDHDLMEKWKKECEKEGKRKKWPKVSELISLPHSYYAELKKVEATGAEIPFLWQRYKKTLDEKILYRIMYHNLYDLIRECCLMLWDETIVKVLGEFMRREEKRKRFFE